MTYSAGAEWRRFVADWHKRLQPGDGAIDIGANTGKVTQVLARRVGPEGFVLAIEPDPVNAKALREHVAQWPWVHVWEAAISDVSSMEVLYQDCHAMRHSLWRDNLLKPQNHEVVPVVSCETLDALAPSVPNLRAIKVDTQGAEMHVLKGGQKTLALPNLVWHVEFWPEGLRHAGSSAMELAAEFQNFGYRPEDRSWDALLEELAPLTGHSAMDVVVVR